MPVLRNARHEKFAQLLSQGKAADDDTLPQAFKAKKAISLD
jgi:hypothetical protein